MAVRIVSERDTVEFRDPEGAVIVHRIVYQANGHPPRIITIDRDKWTPEAEMEAINRDIEAHPPRALRRAVPKESP